MKWMSFKYRGEASFGYLASDGEVVDLGVDGRFASLKQALQAGALEDLCESVPRSCTRTLSQIEFLPPIPDPDKILCAGLNYRDHQAETGRGGEDHPTIFVRFANSQVGHQGEMVRPHESDSLDYEGEIAMLIGRGGRRIAPQNYLAHVFGFCPYNDGSVREYQRHTSQFTPGKNFSGTGGFGPWIMTPDEIGDLGSMVLTTSVNGTRMQYARASDLEFGFAELIAYCSTFTELAAGDIILTGTPGGVGAARTPPVFLKADDVVVVTVDPIGSLENRVVVG